MRRRIFTTVALLAVVAATGIGTSGQAEAAASCNGFGHRDIDGDGYPDFAVGDPAATVGVVPNAGAVEIRYGAGGSELLSQGGVVVGETAETGDLFGASIVVENIDGDDCADILIAAPGEDLDGAADAGLVHLIFGSPDGAGQGRPSLVLRPGTQTLPGAPEAGAEFGAAVAATDYIDEAGKQVAIGAPGVSGDTGSAWIVTIDLDGVASGGHEISESTTGVPGAASPGDRFGSALELGYLDKESRDGYTHDLLVGAPGENGGAGAVVVVSDAGAGAPYTGQYWSQSTAGIDDSAEAGDSFGSSLDYFMNPITGERYVAIGVPGEDLGSARNAGMVHSFAFGGAMKASAEIAISQSTKGVAGAAETGDQFGKSVAIVQYWNLVTTFGLLVGSPNENVGSLKDAGSVALFSVSTSDIGANDRSMTQDSPGVPGAADIGEHLGAGLVGGPMDSLLVGVPDDIGHPTGVVLSLPWTTMFGGSSAGASTWTPAAGTRYGATLG